MSEASRPGIETVALARRMDRVCTRFERAWRDGPRPRIEDHLPAGPPGEVAVILRELVRLEAEYRRRAAEEPRAGDYLARFPDLDPAWLAAVLMPRGLSTVSLSAGAPLSPGAGEARFPPGVVLSGRYRILGPLGKGGMGEVYRADDLKLVQPVALKFLTAELSSDPDRMERLRQEVRVARQVSHPNVCRVHDVGEWKGQTFLSMEYIDGEDLASLLRRIGRLPEDKAVEVARQLCLGLAAAHDKGVLHRDLKPHNVMLDGLGQVRITDFGLAVNARDFHGEEVRAGTPAYQAPEQLAGREVTARSDLYALGLILYEVFTGRKAFDARSRNELLVLQAEKTPASPSSLVGGISPRVERAIMRCLEREPPDRPASALAVAAALPGGDSLAVALAAGTTPTPEAVAASGEEGGLKPGVASALLGIILAGIVLLALLSDSVRLFRQVPMAENERAVLKKRARQVIRDAGFRSPAVDSSSQFIEDPGLLRYLEQRDESANRWGPLAGGSPSAISYWYVQAPHTLERTTLPFPLFPGRASPSAPALRDPGMAAVTLDLMGRLVEFRGAPEPAEAEGGRGETCDWRPLLGLAGLVEGNEDRVRKATPEARWDPNLPHDRREAWTGTFPGESGIPLQVEAASYRGKPVYFQVIGPWQSGPNRPIWVSSSTPSTIIYMSLCLLIALVAGAPLAWRNWRLGRGDRRGALRLGLFLFGIHFLLWLLIAEHVPSFLLENAMLWGGLGISLYYSAPVWVAYLALEPYVRRRWPWRIVSWTRVLGGRLRSPLVGRDVLIGGVLGVALALAHVLPNLVAPWIDLPPPRPLNVYNNGLTNPCFAALGGLSMGVLMALNFFALYFVLNLLLRNEWGAAGALFCLMIGMFYERWVDIEAPWLEFGFAALGTAMAIAVVRRFGLLALTVGYVFFNMLNHRPITLDFSAWYGGASLCYVLALVGLAIYGFVVALGGKPLFRAAFFHED